MEDIVGIGMFNVNQLTSELIHCSDLNKHSFKSIVSSLIYRDKDISKMPYLRLLVSHILFECFESMSHYLNLFDITTRNESGQQFALKSID